MVENLGNLYMIKKKALTIGRFTFTFVTTYMSNSIIDRIAEDGQGYIVLLVQFWIIPSLREHKINPSWIAKQSLLIY